MAKQQLPTNFKDDVLAAQMVGKRRYRVIQNEDGTISLEDVTNYSQIGSNFGAAQTNATNLAVNESFDKNKVIDSLADIVANEATGYAAGALAVRELNGNMPVIQSGAVTCENKANEITSIPVTYPMPFDRTPTVMVTPLSSVPGAILKGVSAGDSTETGFNIYILRTNNTPTKIQWLAVDDGA